MAEREKSNLMNVLEKILEEIENHAIEFESFGMCDDYVSVGWIKEIIRSHMLENDDWVPVEERLPEEGKEVLAQFVVRVVHTNNTVDEEVYIHPLYYENGVWQSFAGVPNGKVEAWCPLPEPYKPKK